MTTDASSPRRKLCPAGSRAAMIAAAFRLSLWGVMTFAAFALGVYAFAFYSVDAINPPFKLRFEAYPVLARLLIFPAGLALIVSAFQFSRRIRTTYPGLHRYSGRIYITAGVAGAVGGFVIAFKAHGSPVTSFSFGTLAVIRACSVAGISLRPRAILPLTRCG